jgi:ribonucleoside-diphosphate reductase alpha chain
MNNIKLTPIAEEVLNYRYLVRNYRGEILETPQDLFRRVARAVAEADSLFEAKASVAAAAEAFEAAMTSLSFLPNSTCNLF